MRQKVALAGARQKWFRDNIRDNELQISPAASAVILFLPNGMPRLLSALSAAGPGEQELTAAERWNTI